MKLYIYILLLLSFLLIGTTTFAQEKKLKFGTYGEILYQHYDYGPNQKLLPTGSKSDSRAIFDVPRFVFNMEYNLSDDIYFEAEVEFEHLGTGSSMELEYEEFGEYEFESEKGGEVLLEEFHFTKVFSEMFNLRLGRIIVPVGLLNKAHKPTQYFSTIRTESVTKIIPTVWNETGVELFGSFQNFDYRLLLVNGLESSSFSSEKWIVEGHQSKFELVKASNLAFAGRIDYHGIKNLKFGISGYYGNSNQNRQKPDDLQGIDGHVTIISSHGEYSDEAFTIRGSYIFGNLENSDIISAANARISTNTQAARTPVAENALAYHVEAGYDVLSLLVPNSQYKIYSFGKYEYYNSMEKVSTGVFADSRFKRNVITFGFNFFVLPNLVLKMDYSKRKVGGFDSRYNDENTFGISIGFLESFIL